MSEAWNKKIASTRCTQHQNAGQPIGADNIYLASLHREQDIVRTAIAAADLNFAPGIGVERGREQNRSGAAAGGADGVRLRANVVEGFDAAPRQRHASIDVRHGAADIGHRGDVELGTRVGHAIERQRLGETPQTPCRPSAPRRRCISPPRSCRRPACSAE